MVTMLKTLRMIFVFHLILQETRQYEVLIQIGDPESDRTAI